MGRRLNPFSAHRIGPVGIGYVFPDGATALGWLDAMLAAPGPIELTAPHGHGKSTLLAAIVSEARRRALPVAVHRCTEEHRGVPMRFFVAPVRGGLVALDGAEQVPRLLLHVLAARARARGSALVLTCHKPLGVGETMPVTCSPGQLGRVIAELAKGFDFAVPGEQVEARLARHRGDVRSVLFELYDDFERA